MKKMIGLYALLVSCFSNAELVGLDENSLENINAQTGIGLNMDLILHVDSITYSDEDTDTSSGGKLQIQDISIGNPTDVSNMTAHSQHLVDVDGVTGLYVDSLFEATRVKIGGISVGDHIGNRSFGQFQFDFEGTNLFNIGDGGTGYLINNTTSFENVDFQWTTNSNTFHIEGMTIDTVLKDAVFEEKETFVGSGQTALVIDMAGFNSDIYIAAMCFSSAACIDSGVAANSLGSLSQSINLINSQIQIHGGGRVGPGVTMNMYFEFDESYNIGGSNQTADGNFVSYTDDATIKLSQQSGSITITNFTFDIGKAETNIGDHIATQFDQLTGNIKFADISIAGNSVGGFETIFDFSDGTHDATDYKNKLFLAPGIAFAGQALSQPFMTDFYANVSTTSDGISIYNEWNMTADFIYTDDGHSVRFDNFQTYGSGYVTLDLRAGGAQSIDSSNGSEAFLAIGVKDYKVNYTLDGLKVGDDTSQLQTGYELLGIAPEAHFTLNAAIEIRGGGANGSGITFDGDVLLSDASFGITRNSVTGNGIYLDGVTYEFSFRDVTFDVDAGGIQLVLGELWSNFTATDIRFGDKATGDSMGALVIQMYQKGSTITISGGGGTAQCIDGTGADASACDTNGGYWLDPETQGLTIASKSLLLQRSGAKENSVTLEANRTAGLGTGISMKVDNIYTSDGYDNDTNTFGIQSTTSINVAKVRILKKVDGMDSNGITGNKGDELITTGLGATEYTYVASPTALEKDARAEALILSNNVQIKELNIGSLQLLHPNAGGAADTLLHGMMLQNLNMTSTLSVTPIR